MPRDALVGAAALSALVAATETASIRPASTLSASRSKGACHASFATSPVREVVESGKRTVRIATGNSVYLLELVADDDQVDRAKRILDAAEPRS